MVRDSGEKFRRRTLQRSAEVGEVIGNTASDKYAKQYMSGRAHEAKQGLMTYSIVDGWDINSSLAAGQPVVGRA